MNSKNVLSDIVRFIPSNELNDIQHSPEAFKKKLKKSVMDSFDKDEYVQKSVSGMIRVLNALTMLKESAPDGYHLAIDLPLFSSNEGLSFDLNTENISFSFSHFFDSTISKFITYDNEKSHHSCAVPCEEYRGNSVVQCSLPLDDPEALRELLSFHNSTCEHTSGNSKKSEDELISVLSEQIVHKCHTRDEATKQIDNLFKESMKSICDISAKKEKMKLGNLVNVFITEYIRFVSEFPCACLELKIHKTNPVNVYPRDRYFYQDLFCYEPTDFHIHLVKDKEYIYRLN